MYLLAEYNIEGAENEIEVVPECWYDKSSNTCWWPPTSFTPNQVNQHVVKKLPHNPETWIAYDANIIATFS